MKKITYLYYYTIIFCSIHTNKQTNKYIFNKINKYNLKVFSHNTVVFVVEHDWTELLSSQALQSKNQIRMNGRFL